MGGLERELSPLAVQPRPSTLLVVLAIRSSFHSILLIELLDVPPLLQDQAGLLHQLLGAFLHRTGHCETSPSNHLKQQIVCDLFSYIYMDYPMYISRKIKKTCNPKRKTAPQ